MNSILGSCARIRPPIREITHQSVSWGKKRDFTLFLLKKAHVGFGESNLAIEA